MKSILLRRDDGGVIVRNMNPVHVLGKMLGLSDADNSEFQFHLAVREIFERVAQSIDTMKVGEAVTMRAGEVNHSFPVERTALDVVEAHAEELRKGGQYLAVALIEPADLPADRSDRNGWRFEDFAKAA